MLMLRTGTLIAITVLGTMVGCAAPAVSGDVDTGEPTLVPAEPSGPRTAETEPPPRREDEIHPTMPGAPRALDLLPRAPAPPGERTKEGSVGKVTQALGTAGGEGSNPRLWNHTLYVADGSGSSGLGSYPVTAAIYSQYTGPRYYVQGPGTWLENSDEILITLASKMYWDCRAGRTEATLAGYSRGPFYALEAHRWAGIWGCAPTVRAALFVDPVDTLIWNFNHVVPSTATVRILRKDWWFNAWAFVFANAPVWGGQQYERWSGTSHPDYGSSPWVAQDIVGYGRWFIGADAFR